MVEGMPVGRVDGRNGLWIGPRRGTSQPIGTLRLSCMVAPRLVALEIEALGKSTCQLKGVFMSIERG